MFNDFYEDNLRRYEQLIAIPIIIVIGILTAAGRRQRPSGFDIWLLFFCVLGVWFFFWGFHRFRRKRLIENIPTSTIRALAMGLVEIVGKVKNRLNLKSPLNEVNCVFYRYLIERYQKSRRSGHWVTIVEGDSSNCPFYLDDGTDRILVNARGAELILPLDYRFETGFGRSLPNNLIQFMERYGIRYKGLFGSTYQLRFREWYICPDEVVYVLGTAKKSGDFLREHNEKLVKHLEELKQSPAKMSELDLDKNGNISIEEWDLARDKIEKEILEEQLKSYQSQELADLVVTQGDTEKIFIISDHSQKELINKLFWQSILGIYGGAALVLVTIFFILMDLRILRF